MEVFEHKRGDSFRVDEPGTLVQDDAGELTMNVNGVQMKGRLLDMTDWQVASQLRNKQTGELVVDLEVVWADRAKGAFALIAKDTTAWPLTTLSWDVQFTDPDGFVTSTDTKHIRIKQDTTRAAE